MNNESEGRLSTSFSSLTSSTKMGGLIEIPLHKQLKNACFALITYLDTTVPSNFTLHKIVGYIRLLQLLGASFCLSFQHLIPRNTAYSILAGVLSIFFHLIPTFARDDVHIPIILTYEVVVLLYILFFVGSSLVFRKAAKINYAAALILNIFTYVICIIIHPIGLNMTGEYIGILIMNPSHNDQIFGIIVVIIAIIIFILHYMIMKSIFTISISFRPMSLPSVDFSITYNSFLMTGIITVITALGTQLPLYPAIALFAIAFFGYIYISVVSNYGATYYDITDQKMIVGISISGAINILIVIVLSVFNFQANLFLWILYVVSFAIGVGTASLIVTRLIINHLNILDSIEESNENSNPLEYINIKKFSTIVVDGFRESHPFCTSLKVFESAVSHFENDHMVYFIYAKFVAIYPEATRILEMISSKLISSGLKHSMDKQIVHQIISVVNQRQNVLSPSLKKKLTEAQKKESAAKRKLLNIWDLVLQGNITELDVAIENAIRSITNAELELNHVRASYPNNTFVARAYMRFMLEIKKDNQASIEEQEKIRKLRRGILAAPDHFNELGLVAFPSLPANIEGATDHNELGQGLFESASGVDFDLDDDGNQLEIEQSEMIRRKINELSIPSVRKSIIFYALATLIGVILPSVLLIALNSLFQQTLEEPTSMMYSVSYMRQLDFQIGTYILRIAVEELPEDPDDPDSPPMGGSGTYYKDYVPEALGSTRNTRDQLKYLLQQVVEAMSYVDAIRSYKPGDSTVDKIRDKMFSKSVNITFTTSLNPPIQEATQASPIDVFNDAVMQASVILNEEMNKDTVNRVEFLNPQVNVGYAATAMGEALTLFVNLAQETSSFYKTLILAVQIGVSILVAILFAGITFYALNTTQKELNEVFHCLAMLPKAVISQAAESQRSIRKNSESQTGTNSEKNEINKQEENIIKVFMSATDSSSGRSILNVIVSIAMVLCVGFNVISINLACETYKSQASSILEVVPHIDYVLGSVTYMYACFLPLNCMILSFTDYNCTTKTPEFYLEKVDFNFDKLRTYIDLMRFGGSSVYDLPYGGFQAGMDAAAIKLDCNEYTEPPTDMAEGYACSDAEFQINLFRGLMRKLLVPFRDKKTPIKANSQLLNDIWVLGPVVLYDTLLYQMFLEIFNVIETSLVEGVDVTIVEMVIMLVLAIIMVIIIFIEIMEIDRRFRFSLMLFLHIPPTTILSIPKITNILSGTFRSTDSEQNSRSNSFYNEIVDKLIDCIILMDEQGTIVQMNKRVEKDFGAAHEDYIGKNITEFFDNYKFEGNINAVISGSSKTEMVKYNDSHYNIMVNVIKGTTVLTLKNETSRVVHSNLIAEERSKSDKMLASILPAALVPRVQAGESNISFAVQSASVLFLDIVSFTPWCGSNQSAYVMKVLNRLFKDLDRVLAEYPTLTKVKCIGDCYMAAGGIFAEVNQPAVHAKEMVEFGLRSIEVVKNIDQDLNEKLQIRVGINTGGPLVAGVLGTAKPTFEILGPTINMAQQMEHHGVPMKVHISRATYELIYGSNFKIKERGEIEVKQGKVNTYLVTSE